MDLASAIKEVSIKKKIFPLYSPYILSIGTLHQITSLQVHLKLNNNLSSYAEVVPLYGYSTETEEQIHFFLKFAIKKLVNKTLPEARNEMEVYKESLPFSVTAILTAIDLFSHQIPSKRNMNIDFVIPCSTENISKLRKVFNENANLGKTIKVKLSGKLNTDIKAMEILSQLHSNIRNRSYHLRLDANQAYNLTDSITLFQFINKLKIKKNIQYIEQPLRVENWFENKILSDKFSQLNVMLDESVINQKHIDICKVLGIKFIKLKLFKQGGISELIELAKYANKCGIKVVIGNGVASAISNDVENYIYSKYNHLFYGASEANGFLKIKN